MASPNLSRTPVKATVLALALAATALLLVLPATQAVPPGATLVDPATDVRLCRVDFGTTGDVTDDAFYLSIQGSPIREGDLRLVALPGRLPGTFVDAGDDAEIGQTADCRAYTVAYYDIDHNARYSVGDGVFLGADADATVQGSTNNEWWIRLRESGNRIAGSLVLAGDADLTSYGAGSPLTGSEFAYADLDADGTFSDDDGGYMTSEAVQTGNAVPTMSVRIAHPYYAFGSQVAPGDIDATPVLTDPEPDMAICRVDYGTAAQVTDDGFYLSVDGNDDVIEIHDVRIVSVFGQAPGSLVRDVDTIERGQSAQCEPYAAAFYDADNNGWFGMGDSLYIGHDGSQALLVEASSNAEWWIRLTPFMGRAAGTIVFAGDPDLVAFGAGQTATGSEPAFVDQDLTDRFSPGDWFYMTSKAVQDGSNVPGASVRLVHPEHPFGSQEGSGGGPTGPTTTTSVTTTTTPPTTTLHPPTWTERFTHEGTVGCAAHIGDLIVRDLCGNASTIRIPIDGRLVGARLVLTWDTRIEGDLEDLRLTIRIGDREYAAESHVANQIVLEIPMQGSVDGLATIEVSAATLGLGPEVILAQDFELRSAWTYAVP